MRKQTVSEADRRLHALLFAIEVHGPSVVHEDPGPSLVKWLRQNYRFGLRQVTQALRDRGMAREEIVDLLREGGPHPDGCACWECVLRMNGEVVRMVARRKAAEEENW